MQHQKSAVEINKVEMEHGSTSRNNKQTAVIAAKRINNNGRMEKDDDDGDMADGGSLVDGMAQNHALLAGATTEHMNTNSSDDDGR